MKYTTPIVIVIIFVSMVTALFFSIGSTQQMTVVYEGNLTKRPIEMVLNQFQDSECGMIIDDLAFASQVIAPDGKTWFFHDHGGMAAWLKTKSFRENAVIWVHDLDSGDWIDARKAWYSRTDHTPMLYGFGAYSLKQNGFIDFETMQLFMARGETIANPKYREQILGE